MVLYIGVTVSTGILGAMLLPIIGARFVAKLFHRVVRL